MCDLVKEIVQRYSTFGELGNFTVFPTFPEWETKKWLQTDPFLCIWCCLKYVIQQYQAVLAQFLSVYAMGSNNRIMLYNHDHVISLGEKGGVVWGKAHSLRLCMPLLYTIIENECSVISSLYTFDPPGGDNAALLLRKVKRFITHPLPLIFTQTQSLLSKYK